MSSQAAAGSVEESGRRPAFPPSSSKGSMQTQDGNSREAASSNDSQVEVAGRQADKHKKAKEAREPLLLDPAEAQEVKEQGPKEETGFRAILVTHSARLVVLFFHGLFVLLASRDLETLDQDSWGWLFVPVWIGNFLAICLLIYSVRASCPYIRRCQAAGRVRLGPYPSMLTDIFPTIFLNILSVIWLLLLSSGEWTLKRYLETDNSRRLVESSVFLIIVCLFSTCVGSLLTHNTPLYISLASAVFASLVTYFWVRGERTELRAWTLLPFLLAVVVIFASTLYRFASHVRLMDSVEVMLRLLEVVALGCLAWALQSMLGKFRDNSLDEASSDGMLVGGAMCLIALLRAYLCYWETVDGTFEDRVIWAAGVPAEGDFEDEEAVIEEIQLQERGQAGPSEGARGNAEEKASASGKKVEVKKPTTQATGKKEEEKKPATQAKDTEAQSTTVAV